MRCLHHAQERAARVLTFEFDVDSSAAAHPARMLYALPYEERACIACRLPRWCLHVTELGGDATAALQPYIKQRVRALRVSAHAVSYGDTASSWKRFRTPAMK